MFSQISASEQESNILFLKDLVYFPTKTKNHGPTCCPRVYARLGSSLTQCFARPTFLSASSLFYSLPRCDCWPLFCFVWAPHTHTHTHRCRQASAELANLLKHYRAAGNLPRPHKLRQWGHRGLRSPNPSTQSPVGQRERQIGNDREPQSDNRKKWPECKYTEIYAESNASKAEV